MILATILCVMSAAIAAACCIRKFVQRQQENAKRWKLEDAERQAVSLERHKITQQRLLASIHDRFPTLIADVLADRDAQSLQNAIFHVRGIPRPAVEEFVRKAALEEALDEIEREYAKMEGKLREDDGA